MSEILNLKAREDRIRQRKQEIVADAILEVLVEHKLTINECYQVLNEAKTIIEYDIGEAILKRKD